MKLSLETKLMVVSKSEKTSEKTGKSYYSIAVVTADGEAGNISCTENCYNSIEEVFKPYVLSLTYNDQYSHLSAVDALMI